MENQFAILLRMKRVQAKIQKFLDDRDWNNLQPADLAKSISIEAAELLEHFQWSNPTAQETLNNAEKLDEIKKELADVMIYCLELSTLLKLDPEKIISDKLDYQTKKYPAALMKKAGKDGAEHSMYLKIKREYRKNKAKIER